MGRLEGASTVQRERERKFSKRRRKQKQERNDYFRDYKLQKKKKEQW